MEAAEYYRNRWPTEVKANLFAMHRASFILRELSETGVKSPKLLDLGCGTGWLTAILSQFGDAEGVDLAPEPARAFHPDLRFHLPTDIPHGSLFDVVVSQEVLEHVEDQQGYVATAHSALRSGGFLILTTPNAKVSLRNPEFLVQPVEKHLTKTELRRLLAKRFIIVKLYSFFFGYGRWPWRLQMRFGKLLGEGLHFMAVCRKL